MIFSSNPAVITNVPMKAEGEEPPTKMTKLAIEEEREEDNVKFFEA